MQAGEFVSRQVSGDVIDFSVGQPSPSLLPHEAIHRAAAHRLGPDSNSQLLLQYGPSRGYKGFRERVARFLTSRYGGHTVEAEQLITTAGVSHGLDLCCRHLSSPGQVVAVESPTYFLAQRIFEQNGLRTLTVRTDVQGIDTQALQHTLEQLHQDDKPALLYTIPVHHNPRGVTLPAERRRHLVRLAHEHGFTIVADEVYQLLSFPGCSPPPPPLRSFERGLPGPSRVASLGSFSKILAPGLRVGWVEADEAVLSRLQCDGTIHSGGCLSSISAGIVHSALDLGLLQQHLDGELAPSLERRAAALCGALRQHLPRATFHVPRGGYFVYLELPKEVDTAELLEYAETQHKVRFAPGHLSSGERNAARLCFAFYSEHELQEGVARLATAVVAWQKLRAHISRSDR